MTKDNQVSLIKRNVKIKYRLSISKLQYYLKYKLDFSILDFVYLCVLLLESDSDTATHIFPTANRGFDHSASIRTF